MDWARAIERNREALIAIVAALFARLGLTGTATVGQISPELHRAVLRVLQPAESAVRRLVVIAARGLVVKLSPSRAMPKGLVIRQGGAPRPASFQLFDRRKRFAPPRRKIGPRLVPRIHIFTADPRVVALWSSPRPAEPAPLPDGSMNAARLSRRLQALKMALDDLPRQARRLVRWRLRREKMPSPKFTSPLRPGPPPGHRRKPVHEVDEVLAQCHWLAFEAMKFNTS